MLAELVERRQRLGLEYANVRGLGSRVYKTVKGWDTEESVVKGLTVQDSSALVGGCRAIVELQQMIRKWAW